MKKLSLLIMMIAANIFAQNSDSTLRQQNNFNYPNGLYSSFESFKNKTPDSQVTLTVKTNEDSIAFRFYNSSTDKKIKRIFAIVYDGDLFIRIKSLMKEFDKDSKGQAWDGGDYYLKTYKVGPFMYMSDYFTSNSAGMLGGLIGAASARREKAIIYDEGNGKFKLFKNFKRLSKYVTENYPDKENLIQEAEGIKEEETKEIDRVKYVLEKL